MQLKEILAADLVCGKAFLKSCSSMLKKESDREIERTRERAREREREREIERQKQWEGEGERESAKSQRVKGTEGQKKRQGG